MIVTVKVKAAAHSDSIVFDEKNKLFLVTVKARPIEGDANVSVIRLLAEHLGVSKSQLTLKSGQKSQIKRFEY